MADLDLLLEAFANTAGLCHPDCVKARSEQEDYDESQSAAMIAVCLISSARVIFKLDTEYTQYSAQYLLDNAGKEEVEGEMDQESSQITLENLLKYTEEHLLIDKEDRQREIDQQRRELTVKDCFEIAFKKGLPIKQHWSHVGCTFKTPPFYCLVPRVPMKGEVIEAANLSDALKLLMQQPVGARLHVFSPEFDRVGEGIYDGPSGNDGTHYVGLRDVMIVAVKPIEEKTVVTVKMCYKKKDLFVKVSTRNMILPRNGDGDGDGDDESQVTEPTCLLVDFCIPRFFVN